MLKNLFDPATPFIDPATPFIDPATPLTTYVGTFLILFFSIFQLCFLDLDNRSDQKIFSNFSRWLAVHSALLATIVVLAYPRPVDLWLALLLIMLAVAVLALIIKQSQPQKKNIKVFLAFIIFGSVLLFWGYDKYNIYGTEITAMLQTEIPPTESGRQEFGRQSNDRLISAMWEKDVVSAFKEKYGVTVAIKGVEPRTTDRLKQFKKVLESNSDVDVFAIDVIWPNLLSDYAEDLSPVFKNDLEHFFPAIIDNNTVNGKLVAIPWYIDLGLLFYRKDLLEKYNEELPKTWSDLEQVAKRIQDAERKSGNKNFWGFVWEGKAGEGLTCNALEWQASHGGGTIVNNKNEVDIKPAAIDAFDEAQKWIWERKISPSDVLGYGQKDMIEAWNQKNAAFMRNWPSAYQASLVKDSNLQAADIGVALLPKGNNNGARHTSTLGGWQLMVNTHSGRRKKKAAIKFVEFLSKDTQEISTLNNSSSPESLVTETGKLSALKGLYDNPDIIGEYLPYLEDLPLKDLLTQDSLMNSSSQIIRRPSTLSGKNYAAVSETYFNIVHGILKRDYKDIQKAVDLLKDDVQRLLSP
jgi:trehalose/maltose transport system substrate-binding protein